MATLASSDTLQQVQSIKQLDGHKATHPQQDDSSVNPGLLKKLYLKAKRVAMEDGDW